MFHQVCSSQLLEPAVQQTGVGLGGGLKNTKGDVIFAGQTLGNPLTPQRSNQTLNVSDTVRIWAFQNANYDWHTFDLDRDMPIIDQKIGFVDATDPDLKKFKAHGGKLLLYAGWADTTITPINTVEYYDSVVRKMGANDTKDFAKLFMVPGMGHCRGGDGPDSFDTIGTLETWREKGQAPTTMAAAAATGTNALRVKETTLSSLRTAILSNRAERAAGALCCGKHLSADTRCSSWASLPAHCAQSRAAPAPHSMRACRALVGGRMATARPRRSLVARSCAERPARSRRACR